MILAAIDIGSNAGRLLVAKIMELKGKPITDKITLVRVPLRLGMDVFEHGEISSYREELLIKTFIAYSKLIDVYQPVSYVACATSAMRNSKNGPKIIDRIKNETGFKLNIIDGLTEARIISAAGNIKIKKPNDYTLYIDVGGGSTELTWYYKDELLAAKSFQIGTIRLLYNMEKKKEWDDLKAWIKDLDIKNHNINCICSGGNIIKLTKLFGDRLKFRITKEQLNDGYRFLEQYTVEERINNLGLKADRADVIVPAAIIFRKIMKWANIDELQVPKIGLADGLLIELYNKHKGNNTILL